MDGGTNKRIDWWTYSYEGWIKRRMDRRTDRRKEEVTSENTEQFTHYISMDSWTDGQTDRWTDGQDRKTDRQMADRFERNKEGRRRFQKKFKMCNQPVEMQVIISFSQSACWLSVRCHDIEQNDIQVNDKAVNCATLSVMTVVLCVTFFTCCMLSIVVLNVV
jgi:hypothetical protein